MVERQLDFYMKDKIIRSHSGGRIGVKGTEKRVIAMANCRHNLGGQKTRFIQAGVGSRVRQAAVIES